MNNFILAKCNTLCGDVEVVGSYGSYYDAKEKMGSEYKKAFNESEETPLHSELNETNAKLCYNTHTVSWGS